MVICRYSRACHPPSSTPYLFLNPLPSVSFGLSFSLSILQIEPRMSWDALVLKGVGLSSRAKMDTFYQELHSYLKKSKVYGVNVDGCILTYIHTYIHTHIHTHTRTHIYIHTYVNTSHTHICTHEIEGVKVDVQDAASQTSTRIHTYTHTHIHTYTHV